MLFYLEVCKDWADFRSPLVECWLNPEHVITAKSDGEGFVVIICRDEVKHTTTLDNWRSFYRATNSRQSPSHE